MVAAEYEIGRAVEVIRPDGSLYFTNYRRLCFPKRIVDTAARQHATRRWTAVKTVVSTDVRAYEPTDEPAIRRLALRLGEVFAPWPSIRPSRAKAWNAGCGPKPKPGPSSMAVSG